MLFTTLSIAFLLHISSQTIAEVSATQTPPPPCLRKPKDEEFFRLLLNDTLVEIPEDDENKHLQEIGERIWKASCERARRENRHGRSGGYSTLHSPKDWPLGSASAVSSLLPLAEHPAFPEMGLPPMPFPWAPNPMLPPLPSLPPDLPPPPPAPAVRLGPIPDKIPGPIPAPISGPNLPPILGAMPAQILEPTGKSFGAIEVRGTMSLDETSENVTISDGKLIVIFAKKTGNILLLSVQDSTTNLLVNDDDNIRKMLKRNPTTGEYYVDSPDQPLSDSEKSLLGIGNPKSRTYWDCNFMLPGQALMYSPLTNVKYKLIKHTNDMVEISFRQRHKKGDPASPPFDFDFRWVMKAQGSKIYWYVAVSHPSNYPEVQLVQFRMVQRLNPLLFNYGILNDQRQRRYPTVPDNTDARSSRVEFAEGRRLFRPEDPAFAGEVHDKYHYLVKTEDDLVHGWATDGTGNFGVWAITPSKEEYLGGGPMKQELSIHVGPIMITTLQSRHIGTPAVWVVAGEKWEKTYGPGVIYVNQGPDRQAIWEDAKRQAAEEQGAWPYTFPEARKYIQPKDRATVRGRITVNDKTNEAIPYENGKVGLGYPSPTDFPLTGWQFEVKHYQYWARLSANGEYSFVNVIPGTYTVYCYIPGILGDFQWTSTIKVKRGADVKVKDITFTTPRVGPTLWEVGIPDRQAGEFYVPKLNPDNRDYPYPETNPYHYRDYGSWFSFASTFPELDPIFQVGSNAFDQPPPQGQWFYVQPSRKLPDNRFSSSIFSIVFYKNADWPKQGDYTLQVAIAGGNSNALLVYLNNLTDAPVLDTAAVSKISGVLDVSLARPTIHGTYAMYTAKIPSRILIDGQNTLLFKLANPKLFEYVLYDYIRFEGPPP